MIDAIVTPSRFLRSKLIQYGFDGEKVVTIHNFIEASAYRPSYGGEGFIYFGRLAEEKGLTTLIEAAALVPDMTIMIAGEGPEREHLDELCLKSGCQNVEFLGYVTRERLLDMVGKAMCIVMPSVCYENFPYAVLEAFALGKPVIASRMGGMPEAVRDGQTGLLFEAGDALALSDRMKYLHNNREAVDSLGRNARSLVETEFSASTHYEKLMEVYTSVTA
jgi:glycosyltransferase involved in cell wall biosynthesis